jgi:DNA-binding CsgD family transcriptional regulator
MDVFIVNCQRFGLTKTEILIFQMLYQELGYREIAKRLGLTEETTTWHIQELWRKTNTRSNVALVIAMLKSN